MSNMATSPGNRPLEQLKVAELRDELKKRGLSLKGVKKELFERLEEAVKKEEQQEIGNGEHEAVQEGAHKMDTSNEMEDVEADGETLDMSKSEASKVHGTAPAYENNTSMDTPLSTSEESTPFAEEMHALPIVSAPNETPGSFQEEAHALPVVSEHDEAPASNEEREQLCIAGAANAEKKNDAVLVDNAVCGNGDTMLLPENVAVVDEVLEPCKDASVMEHVESGNDEKKPSDVQVLERVDALSDAGAASSAAEKVVSDVLDQPLLANDNTAHTSEASGIDCSNLKEDKLAIPDSVIETFSSKAEKTDDDLSVVHPHPQALDMGESVEMSREVVGGLNIESLSSQSITPPKALEPHAGFNSEELERHIIDERGSTIIEEKSDVKLEMASKHEIVNEDGLEKSSIKIEPMEIERRVEERHEATCEVKMELEANEDDTQLKSPLSGPDLKEVNSEHGYKQESRGEESAHSLLDDRKTDEKEGANLKAAEEEDSQARINLKRKENDVDVKHEPAKRMRRWNSGKEVVAEAVKPLTTDSMKEIMLPDSTEEYTSVAAPRVTPKPVATSRALPAKVKVEPEPINNTRTVPPSTRAPSNSLKIDRFVRPFTLKAVKDLLAKFGLCVDFWMDQIKTHCFVTYSSVDEAVAARSGLYGRQWPPSVGNCLVAEFVDVSEVKFRSEGLAEKAQVAPMGVSMRVSNSTVQVPPSRGVQTVSSFRSDSNMLPPPRFSREVQPLPVPKKDPEPAVVTLEDLFFKTKAKPHIYYLPLTDEQVAEKIKKKQGVR